MQSTIQKHDNNIQNGKRILIIYHMDFLKKDCGASMYVYEIVKTLKNMGYSIDFFSGQVIDTFATFQKNNEREKLIDSFYCCSYFDGLPQKHPYSSFTWVNNSILSEFQDVISKNQYDYINIHYPQWLDLIKYTDIPSTTKVVYSMQDMNFFQSYFGGGDYLNTFKDELDLLSYSDEIACISYDEMCLSKKFLPQLPYTHLPHFLPSIKVMDAKKTIDLLYLAFNNPYNLDGAKWFINNVCPLLKPNVKVTFCGRVWTMIDEDKELLLKAKKYKINRIDFAKDLNELYSKVKIAIVPIFRGTGLKIKTIDAMARNIPIVTSLLGVDGFPDKHRNGCLVADEPQEFADNIHKLLDDDKFYLETKKEMKDYFEKYFSDTSCHEKLKQLFSHNNYTRNFSKCSEICVPCLPNETVAEHIETIPALDEIKEAVQAPVAIVETKIEAPIHSITKKQRKNYEKRIKVLGIPILKIRKSEQNQRVFLFGFIQIYRKKTIAG